MVTSVIDGANTAAVNQFCCSYLHQLILITILTLRADGARWSSVVRVFAHGAMGHRIDPSWGGPFELFLVPASAPRLV